MNEQPKEPLPFVVLFVLFVITFVVLWILFGFGSVESWFPENKVNKTTVLVFGRSILIGMLILILVIVIIVIFCRITESFNIHLGRPKTTVTVGSITQKCLSCNIEFRTKSIAIFCERCGKGTLVQKDNKEPDTNYRNIKEPDTNYRNIGNRESGVLCLISMSGKPIQIFLYGTLMGTLELGIPFFIPFTDPVQLQIMLVDEDGAKLFTLQFEVNKFSKYRVYNTSGGIKMEPIPN